MIKIRRKVESESVSNDKNEKNWKSNIKRVRKEKEKERSMI
jgi:hypothetical protein